MSGTRAVLRARILNELKRPSLTAEADKAIDDAIAYYAVKRFAFNEELDTATTTVAGQSDYDLPANFAALIFAEITAGGARNRLYDDLDWSEYRWLTQTEPGNSTPTRICFFAGQYYLYPPPAGAYPVALSFCSTLGVLGDTDSNAWTTTAERLIRQRAKWDLNLNVIRNYAEADACASAEAIEYGNLQQRTAGQGRLKRVRAMAF
jgi:hypothetical protein